MKYDDAVKAAQPSSAIKQKFFSEFIEPYLSVEPSVQELDYFLNQGWHAWRLDVKKDDIKNMLFVEQMCQQLSKKDEKSFLELVSLLLDETNDAEIRTHNSEKNFYEAETIEEKFTSAVRHYKVYFETQFRLWGTIPYFFACKILGLKNAGSTPVTYVRISASTKYYMLRNIQTILPTGDLKDLVKGFNTELRNAGDGHDSYELTDNHTIIMHVVDPKTGKPVGSKKIELTYGELDNFIHTCRKSIWVLRNALSIFLNNNPDFKKKLQHNRPLKISEIKSSLESFAEDRKIAVTKFSVSKDRKNVEVVFAFEPQLSGTGGELLFGNGERYDLINVKIPMRAKYQIVSIFQFIVLMFKEGNTPNILAEVYNEKKELLVQLEYESRELTKFFLPKKEENIPIPKKGQVPDFPYFYIGEVKVPYGKKSIAILLLKSQGYDVIG